MLLFISGGICVAIQGNPCKNSLLHGNFHLVPYLAYTKGNRYAEVANGNELTSVFQALAFSGVALVIAITRHIPKGETIILHL